MVLNNRRSKPDPLEIFLPELSCRHLQKIGNDFNLRSRNPDIPLSRPRAASPTTLTFKMQAGSIPRSSALLFDHSYPTNMKNLESKKSAKKNKNAIERINSNTIVPLLTDLPFTRRYRKTRYQRKVKQAKLPMHTKMVSLELSGSNGKNKNNRTMINDQIATIGQKYTLKPSLENKRRTISAGF
jgi:hypothetical protein